MITVTDNAVKRIKQLLEKHNCEGGLRLGVQGGGCSGMSYLFRLDPKPRATDHILTFDAVNVYVDPKSFPYLDGLTLDFTESLMESAFVWHNPNAKRSCSCGKSFAV
ncbi:MAG TPA: iron-sulfur cluster assembly accessory protein [Bryobacteraceae bacterium]|jgi:iron-sulfur cluster assembly protein|nr:iron-sulfur cluster assembly accessory protein [Bryobacteraceae bacterium]